MILTSCLPYIPGCCAAVLKKRRLGPTKPGKRRYDVNKSDEKGEIFKSVASSSQGGHSIYLCLGVSTGTWLMGRCSSGAKMMFLQAPIDLWAFPVLS